MSLTEAFVSRHFKANQELNNKLLMHPLLESRHVGSIIRCASLCDHRCQSFNFNSLSGMCLLYSSIVRVIPPIQKSMKQDGHTSSNLHHNLRVCILKIAKYIKFKLVNVLIKTFNSMVVEADIIILFFKQIVSF